jgi:hypothetical protein
MHAPRVRNFDGHDVALNYSRSELINVGVSIAKLAEV